MRPGEALEVRLLVDARRSTPGIPEIVGRLFLETNDPDRPYPTFEFRAHFDVPFNVRPATIEVDPLGRKASVVREVRIVPKLGRSADVRVPETVPAGLAVDLVRDDIARPDGGMAPAWTARIRIGPGLPEGVFSTSLWFPTTYREGHLVEIPVRVRVVGSVAFHPQTFELGVVRRGEASQPSAALGRTVALRCTDPDRDLRIGESRIEGDEAAHLRVRVVELEPGRLFEVRLDPDPELGAAVFKGTVVVPTDHPDHPEVRIPYRGFARD